MSYDQHLDSTSVQLDVRHLVSLAMQIFQEKNKKEDTLI